MFLLPGRLVAKTESKIIGNAVLRYRKKASLPRESLAEKADFHPNCVGWIERGECSVSGGILVRIAKALGFPTIQIVPEAIKGGIALRSPASVGLAAVLDEVEARRIRRFAQSYPIRRSSPAPVTKPTVRLSFVAIFSFL